MASEITIKVKAEVNTDAKWLLNRQERMEKQRMKPKRREKWGCRNEMLQQKLQYNSRPGRWV